MALVKHTAADREKVERRPKAVEEAADREVERTVKNAEARRKAVQPTSGKDLRVAPRHDGSVELGSGMVQRAGATRSDPDGVKTGVKGVSKAEQDFEVDRDAKIETAEQAGK